MAPYVLSCKKTPSQRFLLSVFANIARTREVSPRGILCLLGFRVGEEPFQVQQTSLLLTIRNKQRDLLILIFHFHLIYWLSQSARENYQWTKSLRTMNTMINQTFSDWTFKMFFDLLTKDFELEGLNILLVLLY